MAAAGFVGDWESAKPTLVAPIQTNVTIRSCQTTSSGRFDFELKRWLVNVSIFNLYRAPIEVIGCYTWYFANGEVGGQGMIAGLHVSRQIPQSSRRSSDPCNLV